MPELSNLTGYLREVLQVIRRIDANRDADWLFRFKQEEVVGWWDQEESRPPDVIWPRERSETVGKVQVHVQNGKVWVSNLTFKEK
jgi:hypothetical protein